MTVVELSLVLASAMLHALWSTSIKGSRDPLVFNFYQGGVSLALALAVLPLVELDDISPTVWRWLALTVIAHALYFYWLTRALEHGDLTLVYPIARSTPAFLPLLAVPVLGEQLSPGGVSGIAIVVAGMWLVQAGASLDARAFLSPAARFAMLTLAATVVYGLADKAAMAELASGPWNSRVPRAIVFYALLASISALLFSPLVLARRGFRAVRAGARANALPASIASALGLVGYGLILKALETAPASYTVAVRQSSDRARRAAAARDPGARTDRGCGSHRSRRRADRAVGRTLSAGPGPGVPLTPRLRRSGAARARCRRARAGRPPAAAARRSGAPPPPCPPPGRLGRRRRARRPRGRG